MDRQILGLSSSSFGGDSANPPPPEDTWLRTYLKLSRQWESISSTSQAIIPIEISRVNQIDAARLDIEMSAMLKEQLVKVFSLMKPGILFQYEPELDAFLEFLIWRFSIWVDKPTPGNALMNLRYRDERAVEATGKVRTGLEGPGLTVSQKFWYCFATIGGQYFWSRLQSFSAFRRWGNTEQRSLARWSWFLLQKVEGFYTAASFGNLLLFLVTGRYRNIIERALRARLVYGSPNMNRAVSFEYMNRQLVWNEFSEMLLLLLPLLNSSSVKNFLRPFSKDKSSKSDGDDTLCPICQATPTTPFSALPCQHSQKFDAVNYKIFLAGIATIVFEQGVLQQCHSGAPDVMSLSLLCNDKGFREYLSMKIYLRGNIMNRKWHLRPCKIHCWFVNTIL